MIETEYAWVDHGGKGIAGAEHDDTFYLFSGNPGQSQAFKKQTLYVHQKD